MHILCSVIAFCVFSAVAYAQAPADSVLSQRIDIGSRFSVATPKGQGWQKTDESASYHKQLGAEGHSLSLIATTGPSGISREDIVAVGGPDGGNLLVKLLARFGERAWKAHAAGIKDSRFELVNTLNDVVIFNNPGDAEKKHTLGIFSCAYSRIVVRDRGALVDGVPTLLRYVAYTCVELPDMIIAAAVSYSERGREHDLSDDVMVEGERFARSLQRLPFADTPR